MKTCFMASSIGGKHFDDGLNDTTSILILTDLEQVVLVGLA